MAIRDLSTIGATIRTWPRAPHQAHFPARLASHARALAPDAGRATAFTQWMQRQAVSPPTGHCTLPAAFFEAVLGPQLSTVSAHYATGQESLMAAEQAGLRRACAAAGLADGQDILDAGCGWGAMTLLMAESFPRAHITALALSPLQRAYVAAQAAARGLANVTVLGTDMAGFTPAGAYDRIVSMDVFARTANWRALLRALHGWLKPLGRLFLHVPAHITTPSRVAGADWPAVTALSPAIMPSQGLIRQFDDLFAVTAEEHWRGTHAARTNLHWLENFDRNHDRIGRILHAAHGRAADAQARQWRRHFQETAEMHAYGFADVWGTSRFVLTPQPVSGNGAPWCSNDRGRAAHQAAARI